MGISSTRTTTRLIGALALIVALLASGLSPALADQADRVAAPSAAAWQARGGNGNGNSNGGGNGNSNGNGGLWNPWGNDARTTASLKHVVKTVGAEDFHELGITGAGVGVALIDTGVVPVPGLDDEGVVYGPDLSFESQSDDLRYLDGYGHGTHLAGIIAAGTGNDGEKAEVGVAPDATLYSLKVATSEGAVDVTQVIAAVNWVVEHAEETGIRVINLSYGTDSLQDWQVDPLSFAVENAWHNGIVVVAAAGNDGENHSSLRNPATNPWVISVGAADTKGNHTSSDDLVAPYSSVGNDNRRPDLLAPGSGVVSLVSPGSYLAEAYPSALRGDDHIRGSGSSQAAAVVSGAVALLLQAYPDMTPDEVKAYLIDEARTIRKAGPEAGAGVLSLDDDTPPGSYPPQDLPMAQGTGSVHEARGSYILADQGVELIGEFDIMGQPWIAEAFVADTLAGRTWAAGDFNGRTWAGRTWAGDDWSGRTWAGRTWASAAWTGASWSGRTWAGRTWAGRTWAGRTWAGRTWATADTMLGRTWAGDSLG